MASSKMYGARSLVNNYELMLLETNHLSLNPNAAQIQKCFRMLDEILPALGQYQRVMRLIRDQVYEAVFSREYTVAVEPVSPRIANESDTKIKKHSSIERVPHFAILNKIMDERNTRAEVAEEQVAQLKIVVEELDEKNSILNKDIAELKIVVELQKNEIEDLKGNLATQKEENNRLGGELQTQRGEMVSKTEAFEASLSTLNVELARETEKVGALTRFKKCHDDVQDDFRDPSVFSPNPQKGPFTAKERKLRKDIAEGKTLEKQLLMLRNTAIQEFEEYLEREVAKESEGVAVGGGWYAETPSRRFVDVDDLKTEERRRYETAFTSMIANIENELKQNELHLSILKADLDKLNQIKRESQSKPKDKVAQIAAGFRTASPKYTRVGSSAEEDESHLLEVIKNASRDYQFLPQERILSKYAITAFYSCNQGKTFHELQHVRQCKSCGQKTLVCPHKVTTGEQIFHLPLQCTHIKFCRPELQVPATLKEDFSGGVILSESTDSVQPQKLYSRLWNDLRARENSSPRKIPRKLSEDYLVSLINQFFDAIIQSDFTGDEDESASLLESWFAFLKDRYQVVSVAILVANDVLDAIARLAPANGFVQLFAECLCGNLDPAAFRYYLILGRLVKSIDWTSMDDFTRFAEIVYPFMSAEDLEQFTMSYTSFSENKVSAKLICGFFLSIILKQREPGFHEMESKLLNHLDTSSGFMNDVVFFEAMAEISPLSSELLCHRLFTQSNADTEGNHVSILRLSQIGSFLDLQQRTAVMEMEVRKNLRTV